MDHRSEEVFREEFLTVAEDIAERPGDQLGPYRVLEELGEGGFGVVFLAEQQHPVRRRVAIKVIKPGMDTRQVIARFEAERQALALMDHPNIAHVYDAGATPAGRPYFVMELVRGIPITDFCDSNRLTIEERLRLFATVCAAVQHAHQKGIIHRDIKPSNILVTVHDDTAVPKVIDFGVAKATGQTLTDKTLFTACSQLIGTPLYMSPEQADHNGLDVDTRSDIYSLGVLLYELLTGTTPFGRERFLKVACDEMRRILREEEPPKPSTRISTTGAKDSRIYGQRRSDRQKLGQLIRGDLDWIVMKCLEKDRSRRYDSASNLARDIDAYLTNLPVQACPPSAFYRLRKFARRRKTALVVATVLLTTILSAAVVTMRQALRAVRAEAIAESQRIETEARTRFVQNALKSYARRGEFAAAYTLIRFANFQQVVPILQTILSFDLAKSVGPADAFVYGELLMVDGKYSEALRAMRLAEKKGGERWGQFHRNLGWALLANGQNAQADDAFRRMLETAPKVDGEFDWSNTNSDQLTAAYFLDLIDEQKYIDLHKGRNVAFPWFYIGQRREFEGEQAAALAAYNTCVRVGKVNTAQRLVARYRLEKLGHDVPIAP